MKNIKIAILGAGNLGLAIAEGLVNSGINKKKLFLTEKKASRKDDIIKSGFIAIDNNQEAVKQSDVIICAVKPAHFISLLDDIKNVLDIKNHILVSCVTGINSIQIYEALNKNIALYRIMPNTGISIQESMSCISSHNANEEQDKLITGIFSKLGKVIFIQEDLMAAATVMAGCGIAFALRFIRAAMQAGVEIGFTSEIAQVMAAQITKGAAGLVLSTGHHPEEEIDKVTTPSGITITGLNEMEYEGFSSSVIKGMVASFKKVKNS